MDILTPVTHHLHDWSGAVAHAADLARLTEGSLTGLYVFEPYVAMPQTGVPVLISDAVTYMHEHLLAASQAGGQFVAWAKDRGVRHATWRVVQGSYEATIAREAAWCDLVVLGRNDDDPRGDVTTIGLSVLDAELPSLVLPPNVGNADYPHVAIAWNGRVEGTRALQSALPFLRRAKRVTLLRGERVDLPGEARAWTPARDPEAHLAAHGIRVETSEIDADPAKAGEAILDAVQAAGADLLVMGAFGRSRFSEWAIGGATRHVLQFARLPVLMRH